MQPITDFHTHILPEIDDGSKSIDESVTMLQQLYAQGVRRVVLTPHYYPQHISIEDFLSKRQQAFESLLSAEGLPEDIELILAAEVYMHEALINVPREKLRELCIPHTDFILAEFPYGVKLSASVLRRVSALIYNYDCTPILAHIERYFNLLPHKALAPLLDEGCLLQINLKSVEKLSFFKRFRLKRYIREKSVACCGTDCHNLTSRPPQYKESALRLCELYGKSTAKSITTAKIIF